MALEGDQAKRQQEGFAATLPAVKNQFPVERFYQFEYHPNHLPNGTIDKFEISANLTLGARSCGCVRSFLIASDGELHYTVYSRPATASDPSIPQFDGK